MVGERSLLDLNILRRQTLRQLRHLKIKSTFETLSKRFKEEESYNKVRLMSQDEAGFVRISKMSSCWAPQGIRPSIPSHYMREYRYCYGGVDAQTGDSLLLEDAILSGRMNFYGKSHKLIQTTIFYLLWIMLSGINQVL